MTNIEIHLYRADPTRTGDGWKVSVHVNGEIYRLTNHEDPIWPAGRVRSVVKRKRPHAACPGCKEVVFETTDAALLGAAEICAIVGSWESA